MKIYKNITRHGLAVLGALSLMFFIASCGEDDSFDFTPITFRPTADETLTTINNSVVFTDSSSNVASRMWTFDGGSIATSTDEVVTVSYPDPGIFPVNFEVTDAAGKIQKRTFNVEVFDKVVPNFNASRTTARFGSAIDFTNTTTNIVSKWDNAQAFDRYEWTFEGGVPATSTEANPSVIYPEIGQYTVSLKAVRSAPADSATIVRTGLISIVSAEVTSPTSTVLVEIGEEIHLTYPQELAPLEASAKDFFSVMVDGAPAALTSAALKADDANTIVLALENAVTEGQTIILSYDGTLLSADANFVLGGIVDFAVENTVINLFVKGGFEGVTTDQYDVNNGFRGSGADAISVDFVDGTGIDGSRASVWTAAAAVSGNKRTIFGDKDAADIQLVTPVESATTYIVLAMVKYTGAAPVQIGFSMVNFPWNGNPQDCVLDQGTLVEGEFVKIRGEFTTAGNIGPSAYALPNVTVGDGASVITVDNIRVYKK